MFNGFKIDKVISNKGEVMKRLFMVLIIIVGHFIATPVFPDPVISACLYEKIKYASDDDTIGALKTECLEDAKSSTIRSAIKTRLIYQEMQQENPFSLQAHKPNYIILSNNLASPNEQPFDDVDPGRGFDFQPWETKFQLSVKVPVVRNLINGNGDFYVAYTNRSFWQMFNKDGSAPFRDSNHEPEAWLSFKRDLDNTYFGWHNSIIRTGFVHQSNGQSGGLSRSWNRVYADFIFERDNFYLSFKPWWRVPESKDNDDNRNIDRYLGNFELSGVYKKGDHNFDFMIRNNLRSNDNHGAIQLGWSFPVPLLSNNTRWYIQWFNGYGESLIDYDKRSNSIGMGIQLTDWL